MSAQWFYSTAGQNKAGPVSSAQLQALAAGNELQPTDLVWKEGMAQWVPAGKIKGLFSTSSSKIKLEPQQGINAINLASEVIVFGRDSACDHVLNNPMISWHHARIIRSGNQTFLEDLGSTNGTFVNGRRVVGRVLVIPGAVVGLGSYSFRLAAEGQLQMNDLRGNVSLEARGVTVDIPGKRLLENISLVIHPGELVGLMGGSGAGKTTLLNALNGYCAPTEGKVLLNGQDIYGCYRQFAPFIGYVPQDDIIHRDLTVFQALYYSARLRLPPDTTDDEIELRIAEVLSGLGLEGTEQVLIGSPEKRGISGGQRKRVNLAMELLTDPLVLFLDEPTSGLSSQDAEIVMRTLQDLASQGKTILVTIHQPSLEIFRLLDSLVVLAKDTQTQDPGRLAYYGPAYPDALGFFNPAKSDADFNPEDLFKGMGQRPAKAWEHAYLASSYSREYVVDRACLAEQVAAHQIGSDTPHSSFLFQWWTLLRRGLAIKLKDRLNSAILLAQAPVVAIVIVLVFSKQVRQDVSQPDGWKDVVPGLGITLFLMALASVWFGASNAVREVVGEWAIYRRERMVNLSIRAYLGSKFTLLGALAIVQCITLLVITFAGCSLQSSFFLLFFLLLLAALVGITVGLILSAFARTSEVAIGLLPVVILAVVITGGVLQKIFRMPHITQYMSAINPARWCFEGMIQLESGERKKLAGRDMADNFFPRDEQQLNYRSSMYTDFAALLLLLAVGASAGPLILRLRDLPAMSPAGRKFVDEDLERENVH